MKCHDTKSLSQLFWARKQLPLAADVSSLRSKVLCVLTCAPCSDLTNWRPDISALCAKLIFTFGLQMCCPLYKNTVLCLPLGPQLIYTHISWGHSYSSLDYRWEILCSRSSSSTSPWTAPETRWGEPALCLISPSTSHHSCCHTILWSSDFLSWSLSRLHMWETLILLWHGQDKIFLKHWKFLFLFSPKSNCWWEHIICSTKWRAAMGALLSTSQN